MRIFNVVYGATGFFVPLLIVFSILFLLSQKTLPKRKAILTVLLFLLSVLFLFIIALHNINVSRYLFVPTVFCGLFCGYGFEYMNRFFQKKPFCYLSIFLLCVICFYSILQIYTRDRKKYLFDFAETIAKNSKNKKNIFLFDYQSDSSKIKMILRNKFQKIENFDDISIEEYIFDTILKQDWRTSSFYLMLGLPDGFHYSDWLNDFRSLYYVAPFTLLEETRFRSRNQILLCFNGEVGDGLHPINDSELIDLPHAIQLPEATFHVQGVFDNKYFTDNGYFIWPRSNSFSTASYGALRLNNLNNSLTRLSLNICNQIFWPELSFPYTLNTVSSCLELLSDKPITNQLEDASVSPLILSPHKIVCAEDRILIWNNLNVNRGIEDRYSVEVLNDGLKYDVTIIDKVFQKSSRCSFAVIRSPYSDLRGSNLNILFLSTSEIPKQHYINLLNEYIGNGSKIESHVIKPFSNQFSASKDLQTVLSSSKTEDNLYDFIILDLFCQNIYGGDIFQFSYNVFCKLFSSILDTLQTHNPSSRILILVPPCPTNYCLYPGTPNGRLNSLRHYHLVRYLDLFFDRNHYNTVFPVVLYCSLDIDSDYTKERKDNANTTCFGFSNTGYRKIAEDIASNINYYLTTSNN